MESVELHNLVELIRKKVRSVMEKAPDGWEGTVKAMKKDKGIDNPWALAHWMKKKGYKSHKEDVDEDRDYKAEYKKFQSSDKSKKYRAELNQYNRKKGTYGNGDGKDASHKGGKIAGFEAESKNRGRAEKSRLKKEAYAIQYKKDKRYLTSKDTYDRKPQKFDTEKDAKNMLNGLDYQYRGNYKIVKMKESTNEATKVNVDKLLKHPKIKSLLSKLSITGTKSKEDVIKILNYFARNPAMLTSFKMAFEVQEALREGSSNNAVSFWQDMFRPGGIPNKYISQLIKKKGELPSKSHIKRIYKDNGNPSSVDLAKTWKALTKEKYIRKHGSIWKWESSFAW